MYPTWRGGRGRARRAWATLPLPLTTSRVLRPALSREDGTTPVRRGLRSTGITVPVRDSRRAPVHHGIRWRLPRAPASRMLGQRRCHGTLETIRRDKKSTSASMLGRLRTACSFAHRDSSSAALAELSSQDESSRALFVGMMTSSVNGITDARSKPPYEPPGRSSGEPRNDCKHETGDRQRRLHDGRASITKRIFCVRHLNPTCHSGRVLSSRVMSPAAPAGPPTSKGREELGCELEVFHGDSLSLFVSSHNREWPVRCRRAVASVPFRAWRPGRSESPSWSPAGCSSMSQWPAWGMTTAWVAPKDGAPPTARTGMGNVVTIDALLSSTSFGKARNWAKAARIAPGRA